MSPENQERNLTPRDRERIRRGWKLTEGPEGRRWELPGPKNDHARTDINNVTRISRSTAPRSPRTPSPWDQRPSQVYRGADALYTGREMEVMGFRLEDVATPEADAHRPAPEPIAERAPKPHQNEKA